MRADELETIEKTIEITNNNAISGNADKHLPNLVQTSFAQLRAQSTNANQEKVAAYLQKRADTLGNRVLSALAVPELILLPK